MSTRQPSPCTHFLYNTATQFVVEEKIMDRYSVAPLVAVGYEGLFGGLTIVALLPLLERFADRSPYFDLPRGWQQMINTPSVLWSGVAICFSISLFNSHARSMSLISASRNTFAKPNNAVTSLSHKPVPAWEPH